MVDKYAFICPIAHIFSGFALFTKLMWVYRGAESLCKLLNANKVPFDLPTNGERKRRLIAKETSHR